MGVLTNQRGYTSLLHKVVSEKRLVIRVQICDLAEKVLVGCHKIPHCQLGLVVRFDNIRVLRDLGKAHGKSLANCTDLLHRDLDLFRDLIIGDIRILE